MPQEKAAKKKWRLKALNTLLLAVLLLVFVGPFVVYNGGVSIPKGLYWCVPHYTMEDLPSGQVVYFLPPRRVTDLLAERPAFAHRLAELQRPWLKQVESSVGDAVYVAGTHPDSIDSRSIGPIPRASVQRLCTALYTWMPGAP